MLTNGQIAQCAHGANKAFCESIGDFTQPTWADIPLEVKALMVDGVKAILKDPKATPEDVHNKWVKAMKKKGWKYEEKEVVEPVIVRGKKTNKTKVTKVPLLKNEISKVHPLLVPFKDLHESQQLKNALFISVVKALDVDK
ncbi:MAG TPA: hypothetical protein ENH82_10075 [bacterium]|nr:hypothetical protein [bacterium]